MLTIERFKAWLEAMPGDGVVVGYGLECHLCPISKYVAETIRKERYAGYRLPVQIHVTTSTRVRVGVSRSQYNPNEPLAVEVVEHELILPMPDWGRSFVIMVDRLFPHQRVTAKDALAILADVKGDHCDQES